jgi:hypothetical protein
MGVTLCLFRCDTRTKRIVGSANFRIGAAMTLSSSAVIDAAA